MIGWALGSVLVGMRPHSVRISAKADPKSLQSCQIAGLAKIHERETKVRVLSALDHYHKGVKVVVHDLPDNANPAALDLPIAVAILRANGKCFPFSVDTRFSGELTLDGDIRPICGAACLSLDVAGPLVLPRANRWEAGLGTGPVWLVNKLTDLESPEPATQSEFTAPGPVLHPTALDPTFDKIRSMSRVLLVGSPGVGKTMLARAVASAHAPLDHDVALDVARIYSVAGLLQTPLSLSAPFRAPHHTVSVAGMCGTRSRPGEASLAHGGVLFLDELPEFQLAVIKTVVDVLNHGAFKPAQVIAAANPCPCGWRLPRCKCSKRTRELYSRRLNEMKTLLGLTLVHVNGDKVGS